MKRKKIFVLVTFFIVLILVFCGFNNFSKKDNHSNSMSNEKISTKLKAGAARVEIKIPENFFPYDSFKGRHYTGIHDTLYVRTLIVNNDATGMLFISFDTGDISGEWLEKISSITNIPSANIFLTATHTHEAPYISRTLAENLSEPEKSESFKENAWNALVQSIELAKHNMKNCIISYGTGKCDVNVNRNVLQPDGSYRTGVNPEGISDKTISVVSFCDTNSNTIAFLYAYAVHSTMMFFSKIKDGGMFLSGDLAGAASRYVENQTKNTAVALWLLAPCADQGPKLSAVSEVIDENGDHKRLDLEKKGFELVDSLGAEIGSEVLKINKVSQSIENNSVIKSKVEEITIEGTNSPIELRLNVLRFGNIILFGFPGELVTSVGHDIQNAFADLSYNKSIVISQCNGSNGYFSDDFGYDNQTFDGKASSAKKGYNKLVVSMAKRMLKDIQ